MNARRRRRYLAPCRPNPIGLLTVRLIGVEGCRLLILDVDILDGTPVLDIKPHLPPVGAFLDERTGWFGRSTQEIGEVRSDSRFVKAAGPSGENTR